MSSLSAPSILRDKALSALNRLPPFSPTLNRLLASLAKEDVFLHQIAAIIERDTVLTSQVLRVVNSALYARSGTVNSVTHAIAILGLNKLRNMALSLSVSRMWKEVHTPPGWSQAAFNMHAVATAVLADGLAQRLQVRYAEGAFTAGLLHGMGKLLIAVALPEELARILHESEQSPQVPMEDIEIAIIGCAHTELASAALSAWKLPGEIQQAVENQSKMQPKSGLLHELSSLLHVAHLAVMAHDITIPACGHTLRREPAEILLRLDAGLDSEHVLAEFEKEFKVLKAFF